MWTDFKIPLPTPFVKETCIQYTYNLTRCRLWSEGQGLQRCRILACRAGKREGRAQRERERGGVRGSREGGGCEGESEEWGRQRNGLSLAMSDTSHADSIYFEQNVACLDLSSVCAVSAHH